jgi:cysteinyl-tRNA synthetase
VLKLFNTLNRKIEEFKPIGDPVGYYACGPTVYQYVHIGNLRTYIFEDILRRALEFNEYKVLHVVNITDVGHLTSDADTGEDKLELQAKKVGGNAWELAKKYTDAFFKDLERLNVKKPDLTPRATDHIEDMISLIKKLEEKGYTYQTSDGVYFDSSKFKDYGKLARLNLKGQLAGARVEENVEKKSPYDFALWKFSPKGEKRQMQWPSPWGVGFPGWHIECSAMATYYLGQPFDIHAGGIDHIPTHHTNEIAQSEAAYGKPLANYFVHGEFLVWGLDKMSKSLGNIVTLEKLIEQGYDPLSYRYLNLTAHYRSKINFSFDALSAADNALKGLRETVSSYPKPTQVNSEYLAKFKEKINSDLDLPGALALTWELVKSNLPDEIKAATIFKFDEVLGLDLKKSVKKHDETLDRLVAERDRAREEKDFTKADKLKLEIEKRGFGVRDTQGGTVTYEKSGS